MLPSRPSSASTHCHARVSSACTRPSALCSSFVEWCASSAPALLSRRSCTCQVTTSVSSTTGQCTNCLSEEEVMQLQPGKSIDAHGRKRHCACLVTMHMHMHLGQKRQQCLMGLR